MGALQNPAQLRVPAVLYLWGFGAEEKGPHVSSTSQTPALTLDYQDPKPTNPSAGQQLRSSRSWRGRKVRGVRAPPIPHQDGIALAGLLSCPADFSQKRAMPLGSCLLAPRELPIPCSVCLCSLLSPHPASARRMTWLLLGCP